MTTTDKLLPCPFCGGDNVTVFGPVGWYRDYGISHSCAVFYNGTGDFTVGAKSKAQAIAAWNRRASQAAPAPSDGACAECGCAPVNADSLCATCVDERRAPAPSDALQEADQSFVPLYCKGIPADCCDYAVVSLGKQREVCRVWDEADARLIASLLNRAALSTPTEERQ